MADDQQTVDNESEGEGRVMEAFKGVFAAFLMGLFIMVGAIVAGIYARCLYEAVTWGWGLI